MDEKMKNEFFERYLQDFVSMTLKVASDEELQVRVNKVLNVCVHLLQTPALTSSKHFTVYI